MAYELGLAAMNLEMTSKIPHFETDAIVNWDLIKRTTGIEVNSKTPNDIRKQAQDQFLKAWDYDLNLGALIGADILDKKRTSMGTGAFQADNIGFDDNIYCPFKSVEEVLAFDPWETYGKIDKALWTEKFNKQYASLCKNNSTMVNTSGIYSTLITGLTFVFGWEMMLLACGMDPMGFGEVTNRYTSWMLQYYEALADSNVPYIYSHDDIVWTRGAVFRPEWYRKYVFPNLKKLYDPLIEADKKIIFISDGNYNEFVEDVIDLGVHGLFFESYLDLKHLTEAYGKSHILIGNADTRILLMGNKDDIDSEVKRCMDLGRDCPGYFMCVSNGIPYNTPIDNAMYYYESYKKHSKR